MQGELGRLKEAAAINATAQKQSTQGRNQARSGRENSGLMFLPVLGT